MDTYMFVGSAPIAPRFSTTFPSTQNYIHHVCSTFDGGAPIFEAVLPEMYLIRHGCAKFFLGPDPQPILKKRSW